MCIVLVTALLTFSGCDPWTRQEYVSTGDDLSDPDETGGSGEFVGGAEITAFFKGSNASITSGEPPFVLRVSAFGADGVHRQVKVEQISVFDETGGLLQIFEPEASGVLVFQSSSPGRKAWASSDFSSAVVVPDASNAQIGVELRVQVLSNSTWVAETLSFEYELKESSGHFDWLILP